VAIRVFKILHDALKNLNISLKILSFGKPKSLYITTKKKKNRMRMRFLCLVEARGVEPQNQHQKPLLLLDIA
jgi:hypothetical protein